MDPHHTDISTLNGLIKTTIDSVDGYREAAEDANNSQFQSIFFARANEREQVAQKLQEHVTRLGGTPEDSGSITAGAHRVFMNLRDAITGADDDAIIAEVERGEDHIKEKFESAISDHDLSADSRALITQCYESVRSGHDQMSNLKHATQANARSAM
jgi:uncharacterized protein (TIGR02284 family)